MPVYNGARFVRQALDSIVGQTFEDWELIISDNASTDETQDICRPYTRDRRIRYERNESNIGAKANFNRVHELAAGRYFKWAAHDDVCDPRFLARAVDVLDHEGSVVLCHARTSMIDYAGHPIDGGAFARGSMLDANGRTVRLADYDPPRRLDSTDPRRRFHDILLHTHWCFEIFGLIRRETMRRSAGQGLYYGSDKTLLAELALRGRFWELPEELFFRRCHSGTSTNMASFRDREMWSQFPGVRWTPPTQIPCGVGYLNAIIRSPLTATQRLSCLGTLAEWTLQWRKWKSILAGAVPALRRRDLGGHSA